MAFSGRASQPDARTATAYDEAHRFADDQFPRDLWDLGQADLEKITDTFRNIAPKVDAMLLMNPSSKYPHPGRGLIKRVGKADVRVELALAGLSRPFPDRPEEFRYVLSVFRTPRLGFLHDLIHRPRRDHTEWRVIAVYTPTEVRDAGAPLRETLENTARSEFR